jgi:hypothetical protein
VRISTRVIAALAAAVGVASGVLISSPAMASVEDCANYPGTVCLVENFDWSGGVWRQLPEQIKGCRSLVPDNFNDKATLAVNNTDGRIKVYLYENADCTGKSVHISPGYVANLPGLNFNDKASAVRVVRY